MLRATDASPLAGQATRLSQDRLANRAPGRAVTHGSARRRAPTGRRGITRASRVRSGEREAEQGCGDSIWSRWLAAPASNRHCACATARSETGRPHHAESPRANSLGRRCGPRPLSSWLHDSFGFYPIHMAVVRIPDGTVTWATSLDAGALTFSLAALPVAARRKLDCPCCVVFCMALVHVIQPIGLRHSGAEPPICKHRANDRAHRLRRIAPRVGVTRPSVPLTPPHDWPGAWDSFRTCRSRW